MEYEFNKYLIEHGYARFRRMLMGDLPHVKSLAIMNAFRPQFSKSENLKRNKSLEADLRASNYSIIKVKGKYFGQTEDSFIIPHIDREGAVDLGRKYEQDAIIWGRRQESPAVPNFIFSWIDAASGKTTQNRTVTVSNADVQARTDNYTGEPKKDKVDKKTGQKSTPRKVIIPFFDDPYSNYIPGSKYGSITNPSKAPNASDLVDPLSIENYIPLFDESIKGDLPTSIEMDQALSLDSSNLEDEKEIKEFSDIIRRYEKMLYSKYPKEQWVARGTIIECIKRIMELINANNSN